ncbi:MAG: hypothetical protein LBE12_17080 [Planctomycetaceae bacterium]|nr:hypothetical protein [Planctomycetaceae bacterium]
MKGKLQQFVQNRIFRWLLSMVFLCYALVPQFGVCRCSDCHCHDNCNSHQIIVTEEEPTDSVCCCPKELKAAASTVSPEISTVVPRGCCSQMSADAVSSDVQYGSPVCPCSLKSTTEQSNFISPSSISLQKSFDELLMNGYLSYSFPVSVIPVIKIVTFYLLYEPPVSRLPVRLHLLLLVLLN